MAAWQNHRMLKTSEFIISRWMPIWIVLCAATAFRFHSFFISFRTFVDLGIGCVMFLMGISLDLKRLTTLMKNPWPVVLGSAGKWLFAPIIGLLTAILFFGMNSSLADGIVMSGIVPSGTSANLNSLIGGGDVAYSVTMSAVDTFIGPVLTPLLAKLFIGTGVHLAYFPFVWKMLQMVFLPLLAGITVQSIFPRVKEFLAPFTPILSSLALYGIVLGVVSGASDVLYRNSGILLRIGFAVFLQVGAQMMIGFLYGKMLRVDRSSCRSLIFEVGICNSALAAVLSNDVFGPLAAVAAISNMVGNLTLGGLVAACMKRNANVEETRGYDS